MTYRFVCEHRRDVVGLHFLCFFFFLNVASPSLFQIPVLQGRAFFLRVSPTPHNSSMFPAQLFTIISILYISLRLHISNLLGLHRQKFKH